MKSFSVRVQQKYIGSIGNHESMWVTIIGDSYFMLVTGLDHSL